VERTDTTAILDVRGNAAWDDVDKIEDRLRRLENGGRLNVVQKLIIITFDGPIYWPSRRTKMSNSYYLACLDCKSNAINLGKAIRRSYPMSEQETFGFDELAFEPNRNLRLENTLMNVECIDHYLMLHRGHHLIVVSDLADIHGHFPQGFPTIEDNDPMYSRRAFLNEPVNPPNHKLEIENLTEDVINKLQTFRDN